MFSQLRVLFFILKRTPKILFNILNLLVKLNVSKYKRPKDSNIEKLPVKPKEEPKPVPPIGA